MDNSVNKWQTEQKEQKEDSRLLEEVQNKFEAEKYLKGNDLKIQVKNGEVILEGTVVSPLQKNLAQETAAQVKGVVAVHNNIDLGVGRPSEPGKGEQLSSDSLQVSEGSNTGETRVNTPTTTGFTEVLPQTRENVAGRFDSGTVAFDAVQTPLAPEPGSSVMDAGAADAMKSSGGKLNEYEMADLVNKGMQVVDREGKKIGTVKEARLTDFLLKRTFARGLYIPYFACNLDGNRVVVDILAGELYDQGWAEPHL